MDFYDAYFGPYIKVNEEDLNSSQQYDVKACLNETCSQYKKKTNSNYCGECGCEIKDTTITVKKQLNLYDFLGKPLNNYFRIYCHVLVPMNEFVENPYVGGIDTIDINEINQTKIIQDFKIDAHVTSVLNTLTTNKIRYDFHFGFVLF